MKSTDLRHMALNAAPVEVAHLGCRMMPTWRWTERACNRMMAGLLG